MLNFISDNEFNTEFDGVKITVKSRPKDKQYTHHGPVKTRVYVRFDKDSKFGKRLDWNFDDPEELKDKIYRARIKWMKKYVVEPLIKLLKFDDDTRVSFSSKAGCSCGCSPGFIIKSAQQPPFDIFIDIH